MVELVTDTLTEETGGDGGYGDVRQYRYSLGDGVAWGGNDVGNARSTLVQVEGLGGPCPSCGTDFIEFDILLERGVITRVTAIGQVRAHPVPNGFEVLECEPPKPNSG